MEAGGEEGICVGALGGESEDVGKGFEDACGDHDGAVVKCVCHFGWFFVCGICL